MPAIDARVYGSGDRVAFVNSLPCCACTRQGTPRQNHHTKTGGKGYKASAATIVPLCWMCHTDVHAQGAKTFARYARLDWDDVAFKTELLWQLYLSVDWDNHKVYLPPDHAIVRYTSDGFTSDLYVTKNLADKTIAITAAPRRLLTVPSATQPKDADIEDVLWWYRDAQRQVRASHSAPIEDGRAGHSWIGLHPTGALAIVKELAAVGFRVLPSTLTQLENLQ